MEKGVKIKVQYSVKNSLRERFVLWILEKGAPWHYRFCKNRKAWSMNSNDLLCFPEGSLGRNLAYFYKKEGFEPIPKAERHDVFHVLLDYTTEVSDEAAMQFFLLGNGKLSPFTFGTAIIAAILFPLQWRKYKMAYQRGKQCTNISQWNFRDLLHEDLILLKQKVFKINNYENNQ